MHSMFKLTINNSIQIGDHIWPSLFLHFDISNYSLCSITQNACLLWIDDLKIVLLVLLLSCSLFRFLFPPLLLGLTVCDLQLFKLRHSFRFKYFNLSHLLLLLLCSSSQLLLLLLNSLSNPHLLLFAS